MDETPAIIPKYEMIIYTKSNTIPTSHLVLYDQDSVLMACNIFKDLGRSGFDSDLVFEFP